MRTIVVYVATSLDGYLAGPNHDLSWLPVDAETDYEEFLTGVGALAMGRRTYELLPSLGPYPYGDLPAYVLSRSLPPGRRGPVIVTPGPVRALAAELSIGDDIAWLVGGGELIAAFAREGLVDEWIVTVIPVVLGGGVPLVPGAQQRLELAGRRSFAGGLEQLRYRAAR